MVANVNLNASTGAITIADKTEKTGGLKDLGFETFIKMLSVQLQNQDPLNPMDGTAFTEQIATFAQLEQATASNKYLKDLSQAREFSQQTLAVSYIGKDALAPGNNIALKNGEVEFGYSIEAPTLAGAKPAAAATIEIFDDTGALVKTFDVNAGLGSRVLKWDGKNEDDVLQADGAYTIKISTVDEDGQKAGGRTFVYAEVGSVAADAENIVVGLVDGRNVAFDDVLKVRAVANE